MLLWMDAAGRRKDVTCQCDPDLARYGNPDILEGRIAGSIFCLWRILHFRTFIGDDLAVPVSGAKRRTPAKGGDGDESSDAQGDFRDTV